MGELIDIEGLLQPIRDGSRGGDKLQFTRLDTDIEEAMRVSEPGAKGKPKTAEWSTAQKLAEDGLKRKGKDLHIASMLVKALAGGSGTQGVTEGLRFVSRLLEEFWIEVHPALIERDDDDAKRQNEDSLLERSAILVRLERALVEFFQNLPLTIPVEGYAKGFDVLAWQEAEAIGDLRKRDPAAAQLAVKDERNPKLTPEQLKVAYDETSPGMYLALAAQLESVGSVVDNLNGSVKARFGDFAPSFTRLAEVIDDVTSAVNAIMKAKGISRLAIGDGDEVLGGDGDNKKGNRGNSVIRRREDALQQLLQVAEFFKQNEPHSPVPYLILRAEKWARMPFYELMAELIRDDASSLEKLRKLLDVEENKASS